ncbi:MAG: hypothetical protein VYC12_00835 [Candidatus Thermoplasmatota archaeon]|nr:hypothetical protein [Candidatus Thermoplasmatota archaeon]|tara:strand:- start:165 stop:470 length:306 start_codon:yes stop_codon:yes gene_type:complete
MPIYTIENTENGEVFDVMMKIADKDSWLKRNPHCRQIPTAPNINKGGVGDRVKRDGGMNEVLSRIADNNPNSPLADDFGKKDAKSVASRKVAKKVRDSFTT